jgi:CubicO group peptidase (beta-lactamase class C family)
LTHQSGIRTYRGEEIHSTRHYHSLVDALAMFRDDPLEFEPTTRYLYSTYGFNLLGAVVEGVTGSGYVSHVRRSILEPAGMTATRDDDTEAIIPNRADGYRLGPAGILRKSALADVSNKVPGGGLCGTALDLVAFGEALNRGRLLRVDTMELMTRQQPTRSNRPTGYGLGWFVGHDRSEREIWHTGAQPQVTTLLYIQPDRDLVVAILCNLEGAQLKELAQELASTLSSPTPVSSPAFGAIP